ARSSLWAKTASISGTRCNRRANNSLPRQKPAGVIIAGAESYRDLLPLIENATCPIAHITDLSQEPARLVVGLDHHEAGAEPTRFLLSRGYE
ncbi:hypothetical protein ACC740_37055, partial [Rhizobium ruizarguesonis]